MHHNTVSPFIALLPIFVLLLLLGLVTFYMKRAGYYQGDTKDVVVRCRQGHLFTTIWIPFVSFKAIRLGAVRYQYCPVGHHWSVVAIVNVAELTAEERRFAAEHRDNLIP